MLNLAARADVVVENFRAGTVERLGIGYEDIRRINPGIVYCGAISGYGQTGPEALQSSSVTKRGVVQRLEHPELGAVSLIRPAHGLVAQAGAGAKAPPLLGEDTRGVLRDILGFDETRI